MATERFFYWRGYHDALMMLGSDEERGRLVRAMGEWAFNNEEPDFSDSPLLSMAWALVRDQIHESVELGRVASEAGKRGGRPRKNAQKSTPKRVAKRDPFNDPLSDPLSPPKRDPERVPESPLESPPERVVERVPESERNGMDRKGNEIPFPSGKGGGLRAPAEAGATPPYVNLQGYLYPADANGNIIGPPIGPVGPSGQDGI